MQKRSYLSCRRHMTQVQTRARMVHTAMRPTVSRDGELSPWPWT